MRHSLCLLVLLVVCSHTSGASAQLTAPTGVGPAWSASESIATLRTLGYWCDTTGTAQSSANRQAVYAFQKVEHLRRSGRLDAATLARLSVARVPVCRDSIGAHYEVDLNAQVLLVVDSLDCVRRILSVSTGNGQWFETPENGGRYALTPRGRFRVTYKIAGWRTSELGKLYYPMYVRGGVAIHGAPSVPPVPASHGCIRIPMFAARELAAHTPVGTTVVVYGENPKSSKKEELRRKN